MWNSHVALTSGLRLWADGRVRSNIRPRAAHRLRVARNQLAAWPEAGGIRGRCEEDAPLAPVAELSLDALDAPSPVGDALISLADRCCALRRSRSCGR